MVSYKGKTKEKKGKGQKNSAEKTNLDDDEVELSKKINKRFFKEFYNNYVYLET